MRGHSYGDIFFCYGITDWSCQRLSFGAVVKSRGVMSRKHASPQLWLQTEEKGYILDSILTWEVKTSASSGQDATQYLCCIAELQGCYGWVVLIGLGVKATGMGVHNEDTVIL